MATLEHTRIIDIDDHAWQDDLRCRFLSCNKLLSEHDGPNFECSETDCTGFEFPRL